MPFSVENASRSASRFVLGICCIALWTAYGLLVVNDPANSPVTIEMQAPPELREMLSQSRTATVHSCIFDPQFVPSPKITQELRGRMGSKIILSGECDTSAYQDFTYLLADIILSGFEINPLTIYFERGDSPFTGRCGTFYGSLDLIRVSVKCLGPENYALALMILAHELDHARWKYEGKEFIDAPNRADQPHEVRADALGEYFRTEVMFVWYFLRFPNIMRGLINQFYENY